MAHGIEKKYPETGEITSDLLLQHEAFVLNSILSSVAFLESTINELYSDAADNAYFYSDEKTEALLRNVGERWNNEKNFNRAPMLTKYQKILVIAEKSPFDEHEPGLSNVRDLIEVRNYLMHYKREWVVLKNVGEPGDGRETAGEKFEKILRRKFASNPFAHRNRPFFPDKCLGHGCAEWAVMNSLIFTDEFFRRLGLPVPYDGIRGELATR
jgi:hypothetical protein